MFDRELYRADNCSVAGTLALVGERWTFLVLREAFFGVRRFDDFARLLGIARNLLTDRLSTLVDAGILAKEPYRDQGSRERMQYRLTAKGAELVPAVLALMQWGDRHLAGPEGPPIRPVHAGCGSPVQLALACSAGHHVPPYEIEPVAGPGALLVSNAPAAGAG
jgi:DNA-binding HxlR family transcriptional regulator